MLTEFHTFCLVSLDQRPKESEGGNHIAMEYVSKNSRFIGLIEMLLYFSLADPVSKCLLGL